MAAGIDSLGATELQRTLSEELHTELEATLLFDHPSVDGIVSLLVSNFLDVRLPITRKVRHKKNGDIALFTAPLQAPTQRSVFKDREAPSQMKAVYAAKNGGGIEWRDLFRPKFSRGQQHMVVVAVCNVGLSFADNLFLHGRYQVKKRQPIIPGLEGSGVVTATSRGCVSLLLSDKVGFASLSNGGCAEEVLFENSECVKISHETSDFQFLTYAALGINYATAYFAFVYRAPIPAWDGNLVLVLGAAGGVGLAAIGVGKLLGLTKVIACASTPRKRRLCEEHGASFVVDYTTRNWHRDVANLSDEAGVHCVLDPVGGDHMIGCLRCTRPGGCVLTIGYASGIIPKVPVEQLLQRNISLVGVWATPSHYPAEMQDSSSKCATHWLQGMFKLVIDEVLPMSLLRYGLAKIVNRQVQGKVVVVIESAEWASIAPACIHPSIPLERDKRTQNPFDQDKKTTRRLE